MNEIVWLAGKGTHHLVRRNDDGFLTVNKKTYGESRTIEELIETLKQPCDGWPVLLTTHPETHPANDKGNATPAQQGTVSTDFGRCCAQQV